MSTDVCTRTVGRLRAGDRVEFPCTRAPFRYPSTTWPSSTALQLWAAHHVNCAIGTGTRQGDDDVDRRDLNTAAGIRSGCVSRSAELAHDIAADNFDQVGNGRPTSSVNGPALSAIPTAAVPARWRSLTTATARISATRHFILASCYRTSARRSSAVAWWSWLPSSLRPGEPAPIGESDVATASPPSEAIRLTQTDSGRARADPSLA